MRKSWRRWGKRTLIFLAKKEQDDHSDDEDEADEEVEDEEVEDDQDEADQEET
jgi:hypothetical protein